MRLQGIEWDRIHFGPTPPITEDQAEDYPPAGCSGATTDHRAPSTHSRQRPAYGKINVSFNQNFPRLPPQKSDLWTQEWLFKMCNLLAGGWCVQLYLLRQPLDPFMSPVSVWRPSPVLTFPSTLKPQIEGIILLVLDK